MRLAILILVACGSTAPAPARTIMPGPPDQPRGDLAIALRALQDVRTAGRALGTIEALGDPAAIAPVGEYWIASRSDRAFRMLVDLARPLAADQAKERHLVRYETSGRPASWHQALPYLQKALERFDPEDLQSSNDAIRAADAIGEARLDVALLVLHDIATRSPTRKSMPARIAAIRAMGKLDANGAAVDSLGILARRPPPPRPTKRDSAEPFSLHLTITGAAVDALGELGNRRAVRDLVPLIYRMPELAPEIRRALAAIKGDAARDYRQLLRGEHHAIDNTIQTLELDRACDARGGCQSISLRDFYAAQILGDLHASDAVGDLMAALARPPLPASVTIDGQPGPTQHIAILETLGKLGPAEVAEPLRVLWSRAVTPLPTRIAAIDAYAFAARDTAGVNALGKIMADNTADDGLRESAAIAYARLARGTANIPALIAISKKYGDAAKKKRTEVDRARPALDTADADLANARQQLRAARRSHATLIGDPNSTGEDIMTAIARVRQASARVADAERTHQKQSAFHGSLEAAAAKYGALARSLRMHVAGIELAGRCKDDMRCYAAALRMSTDEATRHLAPFLPDIDRWTIDDLREVLAAYIDRAVVELGKMGSRAEPVVDALLDVATSEHRNVRIAVLLALPKIAPAPCPACVTRLDEVLLTAQTRTALAGAQGLDDFLETQIVRGYFAR